MSEFERIIKMLMSVEPDLDPESQHGKAQRVRAMLGSIEPRLEMQALCNCGWKGTILDTKEETYRSDETSWHMHGGRQGWHYICPKCGAVVWRYYNVIN
jgi:hypothetical protein